MKTPVTIVIPTFNAGEKFKECAEMIVKQTANVKQVLIIDSQSEDSTVQICKGFGFAVDVINRASFGHGKTRQYALENYENAMQNYNGVVSKYDTKSSAIAKQHDEALLALEATLERWLDFS